MCHKPAALPAPEIRPTKTTTTVDVQACHDSVEGASLQLNGKGLACFHIF